MITPRNTKVTSSGGVLFVKGKDNTPAIAYLHAGNVIACLKEIGVGYESMVAAIEKGRAELEVELETRGWD